jgi:hypothetical protein
MHRVIMNAPAGVQVDHANGDRLDNRRSNLRLCDQTLNNANRRAGKPSRSGFRGVYFDNNSAAHPSPWLAEIQVRRVRIRLGHHATPEIAARAYDRAARDAFGLFARLNFPDAETA